ncbi:MAG TPA: hypothetical protein VG013_23745 [Gemmataceae bacterium]|jgi:hypothetical protein|nr:hypothetical protein [Gemmataceae bacterium]
MFLQLVLAAVASLPGFLAEKDRRDHKAFLAGTGGDVWVTSPPKLLDRAEGLLRMCFVRKGMTKEQVVRNLGCPDAVYFHVSWAAELDYSRYGLTVTVDSQRGMLWWQRWRTIPR